MVFKLCQSSIPRHAALTLGESGYQHEARPLVRSIIEHAIAIRWVADRPAQDFEALPRTGQRRDSDVVEE